MSPQPSEGTTKQLECQSNLDRIGQKCTTCLPKIFCTLYLLFMKKSILDRELKLRGYSLVRNFVLRA